MSRKFKTAEEWLATPAEERQAIIKRIAELGYVADPWDYIDLEDEREVYSKLQIHYQRLEKLAYAIGDELREFDDETEHDLDSTLHEFMTAVADECEQQYCGEYYGHEDGFWVPSVC